MRSRQARTPRRCYLHVGTPKTGTTYLQDVLWASRRELRRQGVRLPLRHVEDHYFLTLALRGRLDPDVDPARAHTVLDRLRRDVRRGSRDLLISHELLAAVDERGVDELLAMLSRFEVHVVITARDLARQVPAEWQQQVKTRATTPYGVFLDRVVAGRARHFWTVQDVAGVAARWGRGLPPERVHLVTVPPPGERPGELLARFCAAVGLDPAPLTQDEARSNASLGHDQTELLRRVNVALGDRLPHPRDDYGAIAKFWFAERVMGGQPSRRPLGLPLEHHEWAVRTAKETVVRLEDAGYQVHGDLSDLVPVSTPTRALRRAHEADVIAAGVETLAALLAERRSRPQHVWRRRLSAVRHPESVARWWRARPV